ncbi:MAG: GAF domain-containing protein, partial [Oscillospiraceae bacterium]|nr:GAF domain-containing protein [Oscillospiraceae bacterium]
MNLFDKKPKKDLQMLMWDTTPLCMQIWDKDMRTIDCNDAAVKLYGFKDKTGYINNFITECSPEFQPNGERSSDKAAEYVRRAFETGRCVFDWMHRIPDTDEPVPAEIHLIRSTYRNEEVVIGYTRDLREQFQMKKNIRQRDKLLKAVNQVAVTMLSTEEDEDIEIPLIKGMELIGNSLGVDHVHIWRNETISGSLKFMLAYTWLSESAKEKGLKPRSGSMYPFRNKFVWINKFMQGDYVGGQYARLSDEEKDYFEAHNLNPVIIIPLFLDKKFWGLFTVDSSTVDENEPFHDFSDEEIDILRSVSLMLSNGINRHALIEKRTHELSEANEKARAASQAKSDFLANMSHEIRAPINVIVGLTELMLDSELSVTGSKDYLQKINTAGIALVGVINNILDFSKIEARKFILSSAEYELASLLKDVVTL